MLIKQSSSNKVVPFFLVDSTDHISPKTGLTPTVTISKNGAAFGAPAGAVTEIGSGWYKIAGNATDSNTVGSLLVHATGTGADPFDVIHEVVEATLAKGTDITGFNDLSAANIQTELTTYGALKPTAAGRTLDITATGEAGIDWANIGAPTTTVALSATTIATVTNLTNDPPGVTTLLARITSTLFSGITSLKEWLGLLAGKQVGNATARTEIRSTGAGSGTFDETVDSQEALRDRGDAAWITGAGGDPWATAVPGAYAAGTAGNILGNRLDAAVSTRAAPGVAMTLTSAYDAAKTAATQASVNTIDDFVDSEVGAIKVVTDKLDTALELDGAVYRYTTNALEQAPTSGGGGADPWLTALPGAYGAGTAGNIIGNNLNATVSSRATPAQVQTELNTYGALKPTVAARTLDVSATGEAGVDWANVGSPTTTQNLSATTISTSQTVGSVTNPVTLTAAYDAAKTAATQTSVNTLSTYVDTEVAAIKAKTDALPASPAAVSDIPTAIQNADALLKRDMAAVTGEASRSPLNAMRLLRNKWSAVETPNTLTVKREDDVTTAWTASLTTDSAAAPITSADPAG